MGDDRKPRPFVLKWRSAVLNSALPSTTKLTLLTLAEFANRDGGDCCPGVDSIAKLCSLSDRSCRGALSSVENTWFLRVPVKFAGRDWKGYRYTLLMPEGAEAAAATGREGAEAAAATGGVSTGKSCSEYRQIVPRVPAPVADDLGRAPRVKAPRKELLIKPTLGEDRFDEFWMIYPRSDAKAKARAIWNAKRLAIEADQIIADVRDRLADSGQWTDPKYIPHATTYLNQRRWEDEWKRSTSNVVTLLPRELDHERINRASMLRMGLKP